MNPNDTTVPPGADKGAIQNVTAASQAAPQQIVSAADNVSPDESKVKEVALPAGAEDSDLIEKEWVEIAKQIVEHTRDDPYEQQRALSQMKADYLKKRYNKDIKISEE